MQAWAVRPDLMSQTLFYLNGFFNICGTPLISSDDLALHGGTHVVACAHARHVVNMNC